MKFPSHEAFDRYKSNDKLLALAPLREKAISQSTVYIPPTKVDYAAQEQSSQQLILALAASQFILAQGDPYTFTLDGPKSSQLPAIAAMLHDKTKKLRYSQGLYLLSFADLLPNKIVFSQRINRID